MHLISSIIRAARAPAPTFSHLATSCAIAGSTALIALVLAATATATQVYQCDGPDGPLFSQTPCATDAVVRRIDVSRPAQPTSNDAFAPIELDATDEEEDSDADIETDER